MNAVGLVAIALCLPAADRKDEPKIDYRGKKITVEKFRKACKKVSYKELQNSDKLIGFAVQVEAPIVEMNDDEWIVTMIDRKGKELGNLTVDAAKIEGKFKPGLTVVIFGICAEGPTIEAVLVDLSPPGVQWAYKLRDPGAVKAGESQDFIVDAIVKNTGKQPIKSLDVAVRLYQDASPNDFKEEITLEDLQPGEERAFSVTYGAYNYEYIGATSVPKVEFNVLDYEL